MSDENKIGFAQCPIDEASCSSVKEQEPRSLREQIKSHEESTMTLMEEKQEKEDENRDYDAEHDEYENIPESPDIAANGAHSVHERQMKEQRDAKILADFLQFKKTMSDEDTLRLYISCMDK